jgi:hypothetical protein
MYVRWQERKQQDGMTHWTAVLAKSIWVKGKPKQQHVASLGGITKTEAKTDAARYEFWLNALEKLSTLSPSDQRKIEAALVLRVPRPTDLQLKKYRLRELACMQTKAERLVQDIKHEIKITISKGVGQGRSNFLASLRGVILVIDEAHRLSIDEIHRRIDEAHRRR